jgi:hypothetical protein
MAAFFLLALVFLLPAYNKVKKQLEALQKENKELHRQQRIILNRLHKEREGM